MSSLIKRTLSRIEDEVKDVASFAGLRTAKPWVSSKRPRYNKVRFPRASYKAGPYRGGGGHMKAPGLENGNVKIVRILEANPSTRIAATSETFALKFTDISDNADLAAVYNRFRITRVDVKWRNYISSKDNAYPEYSNAGALVGYVGPRYDFVAVYDGGSTDALGSLQAGVEKGGKILDGRKDHSFSYVPNIIQADGSTKKSPWLDVSDNNADNHYGLKLYVNVPPLGWAVGQIFNGAVYQINMHVELSMS